MATKGTKDTKGRIWIPIILCVPARIAVAVDWENLELLPGSFIAPRFRAHESDPLFAAPLAGGEARFDLLFEHQTAEDKVIALRLMRYIGKSTWPILRENVLDALELRFDAVPPGLVEAVRTLADEETLKSLHRRAIRCTSIEDFAAGM